MAKTLREIANFSQADLQSLLDTRKLIQDLLPAIEQAEECGQECENFRQMLTVADQRLSKIQELAMPPATVQGV